MMGSSTARWAAMNWARGSPARLRHPIEPEPPHREGVGQLEPLHGAAEVGVVEARRPQQGHDHAHDRRGGRVRCVVRDGVGGSLGRSFGAVPPHGRPLASVSSRAVSFVGPLRPRLLGKMQ